MSHFGQLAQVATLIVCLAVADYASAQSRTTKSTRTAARPSITDRIGQFGRNIFGRGEDPQQQPQHRHPTQQPRSGSVTSRHPRPTTRGAAPRAQQEAPVYIEEETVAEVPMEQEEPLPTRGTGRSSRRTAQPGYRPAREHIPSEDETVAESATEHATGVPSVEAPDDPDWIDISDPATQTPPNGQRSLQDRLKRARRIPYGQRGIVDTSADHEREAAMEATEPPTTSLPDEPTEESDVEASVPDDQPADEFPSDETDAYETSAAEAPVEHVARSTATPSQELDSIEPAEEPGGADVPVAVPGPSSEPARREQQPAQVESTINESPVLVVKTTGPRKIKVGEAATYTVAVENNGRGAAHEVVVTVQLPEWAELVSAESNQRIPSSTESVAGGIQWHIDQLGPSERHALSLRIIPHKSQSFDLGVTWAHSPLAMQTAVEVQEPKLTMSLAGAEEVEFGKRELYRLTLSNPGTGDAENVVIRLLPTTQGDTGAASHSVGNIAAGQSKVVELELTARDSGPLVIHAEATGDGSLQASVHQEVLVRRASLVAQIAGPRVHYAGRVTTYKVRVRNNGNAAAQNVELSAVLPSGAKLVSADGGGQSDPNQGSVHWRLEGLRPGEEQIYSVKCRLDGVGSNRWQVAATADGDLHHNAAMVTKVEALADLAMDLTDPEGPCPVGDEATYEVRIRNRGSKRAEQVDCIVFFSEGIEPVGASGAQFELATGQVKIAPLQSLEPGQEVVVKIVAKAQAAGNHVCRAQLRCPTLNIALAKEESTTFYDVESSGLDESETAPEVTAGLERPSPR